MSIRNHQCIGCGRYFNVEGKCCSKDFALSANPIKPRHISIWCAACGDVTMYRPARLLGLEIIFYWVKREISLVSFMTESKWGRTLDPFGFSPRTHMIRRIWFSFCDRIGEIEHHSEHEEAFRLLVESQPRPLALAITLQLKQRDLGLEEIADAMFYADGFSQHSFSWHEYIDDWIKRLPNPNTASDLASSIAEYETVYGPICTEPCSDKGTK